MLFKEERKSKTMGITSIIRKYLGKKESDNS